MTYKLISLIINLPLDKANHFLQVDKANHTCNLQADKANHNLHVDRLIITYKLIWLLLEFFFS